MDTSHDPRLWVFLLLQTRFEIKIWLLMHNFVGQKFTKERC